jgi:Zn-dependent protease with chaperone function
MNEAPNAYTFGDKQAAITVTSGLIEHLDEDEVQAVIAHEVGHIVCQHTLYHTMATLLIQLGSSVFGPLAALSMPIQIALLYWNRRSELSADRAAAVVMHGPMPVVNTMIRLAGGPKSITGTVNLEAYLKQADAYDRLMDSQWDQLLQGLAVMNQDHPLLAVRSREIMRWCKTEHFQRLVQSVQAGPGADRCASCSGILQPTWKFCQGCGSPNPSFAAPNATATTTATQTTATPAAAATTTGEAGNP